MALLNDDFMLTTEWAKKLFHTHAEKMPIIDYHCHLDPQQIYEDKHFENLTEVWLFDHGAGDHYKWRLMRANGVPEELITGDGDPKEKYLAFVDTLQRAIGNPIYEWSHLELRRAFGIDLQIKPENYEEIWERANAVIASPEFSARNLIRKFDVRCVCTTDNPASELEWHQKIAAEGDSVGFKVLPTYRPDDLLGIDKSSFVDYCKTLSAVSGVEIYDFASLKRAAAQRVDFFHSVGGRFADHGANSFYYHEGTAEEVSGIVSRALAGKTPTAEETGVYQTAMTLFLMGQYENHGWTMQIHGNCFRNDSTVNFEKIGVDAGFDTVGDQPDYVYQTKLLLDAAQQRGALPRMILYSLNDSDWLALASLAGAFQGGCVNRIQFGNAWWFNDTFSGMKKQITMFAELGLLGNFTGMLTDSRSFLSYPRHEYFRRILCQVIGEWVERGQLPEDEELLGGIVEDICYNNAHDQYGFFA